jgi:hypothetical protein
MVTCVERFYAVRTTPVYYKVRICQRKSKPLVCHEIQTAKEAQGHGILRGDLNQAVPTTYVKMKMGPEAEAFGPFEFCSDKRGTDSKILSATACYVCLH